MERATFTVSFFVKRTKTLKDGSLPIFARITINGERTEFGLQKSVSFEHWEKFQSRHGQNSASVRRLNTLFDHVKLLLYQHKMELERDGVPVTAKSLKNAYMGIEENQRTVLEVFKEHNERAKNLIGIDIAQGTYERYQTCYTHVERFMEFMYHKKDMKLNMLKPSFIKDFEFYLKTERKCQHNSATKYLKNFKKITRIALANGWMKDDPFKGIKFRLDEVDMDFLTAQELHTMINKKMPVERLELVKDVYLFCCFSGLAFADIKSLSESDFEKRENQLWIKKRRQKTKNWCNIPLLPPAKKLMEKYEHHPQRRKSGLIFPVLSNQKMNAYLKEIAALCGIEKNLSTHTARHTFATTVTLSNQISIEVVSKMLGHSSINMTKKYARVVDDLINKDMQKVYKKYKMLYVA